MNGRAVGWLVVAITDTLNVRHRAETVQALNPDIEIVLWTRREGESVLLGCEKIGLAFSAKKRWPRA